MPVNAGMQPMVDDPNHCAELAANGRAASFLEELRRGDRMTTMNTMNTDVRMPLLSYVHAAAVAALVSAVWLRQSDTDPPSLTILFMALVVLVLGPILFGGFAHVLGELCVRCGIFIQVNILQDEFAAWVVGTTKFIGFLLRSAVIYGCVHLTYRFAFPDWFV